MTLHDTAAVPDLRRDAPATRRNAEPLLAVLRAVLPASGQVLEAAAGTGQHAIFFARALPGLRWIPSDPDPQQRASIAAWRAAEGTDNLAPPIDLNVADPSATWPAADAVACINMIHISPWAATLGLMAGAARILPPGGPLIVYGAFKRDGRHTAPSNAAFDDDLRARNPEWGVRDLADVDAAAAADGLIDMQIIDMPANNLAIVWRKRG